MKIRRDRNAALEVTTRLVALSTLSESRRRRRLRVVYDGTKKRLYQINKYIYIYIFGPFGGVDYAIGY